MTDANQVLAALQFAYPSGLSAGQIAWQLSLPLYRVESALAELVRHGLAAFDAEQARYIYRPKRVT
ncbi:MAG TPA: hypothetical protein VIL95_08995 [Bacillota bacterium]